MSYRPSISNFVMQKTAEAANAVKETVEQDLPLTASQRQRVEEVLCRALSITIEDFRRYARHLEMIRMEDSRKVIEGFHKHLRLTSRAMEHCIVPLLDALPYVKVCSFVECHVEKGAFIPLLKKKKKELTDIMITRTLTNNEAGKVAEETQTTILPSDRAVREAWLKNEVPFGYSCTDTDEGPVKVVVNPYYLPDDTDLAQAFHSKCPKVEGYPERMLWILKRSIKFDINGFLASFDQDTLYDFRGKYNFALLPLPIRLYEDIGFGSVDLTQEGLQPIDPSKTEEDIEIFVANAMEKLKPEIEVVIDNEG